ncbi:CS1 type fimbrial major subunit [Marinomonas shanghaiensis]|uniref:CS1 type fimbrial major subunit n=1 Tax=Marinomonas shanghaiensis TaxID=2202418 RepID=UPI000DBAD854|nr:CS1 type fimbrial major subunit [Marinomonas shanghaiensis]
MRQFLHCSVLLLLSLNSFLLNAAALKKDFVLVLQLPRTHFIVTAPDSDPWLGKPQRMEWDMSRRQFYPLNKQLLIQSSVGAVSARLLDNPQLSNGAEHINLNVKLNQVELGLRSSQILSAAEAIEQTLVQLSISTKPRADGRSYFPGSYSGIVTLLLETSAP